MFCRHVLEQRPEQLIFHSEVVKRHHHAFKRFGTASPFVDRRDVFVAHVAQPGSDCRTVAAWSSFIGARLSYRTPLIRRLLRANAFEPDHIAKQPGKPQGPPNSSRYIRAEPRCCWREEREVRSWWHAA